MTMDPGRLHNLDFSCYKSSTKSAHLWRSAGTVHSQRHRKGTADHMDLKKGTQEIAAAQSQHFLHMNVMCLQDEMRHEFWTSEGYFFSTWLGSTLYPCLAAKVLPIAKLMTYPTIARENAVLNMSSHWLAVGRTGAGNLKNKDKSELSSKQLHEKTELTNHWWLCYPNGISPTMSMW